MKLRKLFISALASSALLLGIASPANAAICANGVNVSVLGDANQDNDCETNVDAGLETPDAPALPTP